jgi:hypothetical protein
MGWLGQYRQLWNDRLDRLEQYLEDLKLQEKRGGDDDAC